MKMMLTMVEAARPLVSSRMARILVAALVVATLTLLLVSNAMACDPSTGAGC